MRVAVRVAFGSAAQARAAVKALIADNVNLPKGLSLDIFTRGAVVHVLLEGKGGAVQMGTVTNTLDEVLEHLSVAKRVMML
ncbi:MAG: hypothetical protein C4292_01240 [Nitrososphaera sp.]